MNFDDYIAEAFSKLAVNNSPAHPVYEQHDLADDLRYELIELRRTQEISQTEWAELSGVPLSRICSFVNGTSVPSIEEIQKLADALNLKVVVSFVDKEEI